VQPICDGREGAQRNILRVYEPLKMCALCRQPGQNPYSHLQLRSEVRKLHIAYQPLQVHAWHGIVRCTKYLRMWSTEQCLASSKILTSPTPSRVSTRTKGEGGTHSPGGEGVGGQYFGRRQTLDWPLTVYSLYGLMPLARMGHGQILENQLNFTSDMFDSCSENDKY
jgi:hypothetical protein